MRHRLILVLLSCLAITALVACSGDGGNGSRTPASQKTPSASPTSSAPVESPGIEVAFGSQAVAFDFAPDGRLFFTQRTVGEIHIAALTTGSLTPEQEGLPPVLAAKQQLAQQAGVEAKQIVVISVTANQWPDSCLGLGAAGETCSQAITSGYEVVLRVVSGAGAYIYRTDQADRVRLKRLEAIATGSDVFATLDVFQGSECGLLGIAVDPDFATNHYVYVYATVPVPNRSEVGQPRIIRYTEVNGQGTDPTVILADLPTTNPKTCAHVSGNVHFGPDGYLYVSIGNFEEPETSGDLTKLTGKILRLNKVDGSAAPGNPFENDTGADKRIFAYGLRNPFDFAFEPTTGRIYAPDNGPGNCDELNIIEPGADYGVPGSLPSMEATTCLGLGGVDPIYLFTGNGKRPEEFGSNVAPAGVAFLDGDRYPGLGAGLLVCEFNPGELHFLELTGPRLDQVARDIVLADCRFNVEVHNGRIYYSNSKGIFELQPSAAADLPQRSPS